MRYVPEIRTAMKVLSYPQSAHNTLTLMIALLIIFRAPAYRTAERPTPFAFGQQALEATVKIETVYEEDGLTVARQGSGAIITKDGLIVTNEHNIGEARHIEVTLNDGFKMLARLIAADPRTDLALLKVEGVRLPCLKLGDSRALQLGEAVFAAGNPHKLDFTLTSGVVSAFNRQLKVIHHPSPLEHFIQTDAAINSGCSGGPLLNQRGELVGVNTALVGKSGHFEGYSFAQPVELVKEFLDICEINH